MELVQASNFETQPMCFNGCGVVCGCTLSHARAILHNAQKLGLDANLLQTEMAQAGVIVPFLDMMAHVNDQVVQETLAVFVQILEGGNDAAQTAFLNHCMHTREEQFFVSVRSLLRKGRERIAAHLRIQKGEVVITDDELADGQPGGGNTWRPGSGGSHRLNAVHPEDDPASPLHQTSSSSTDSAVGMQGSLQAEKVETFGNCELLLRCAQLLCEGHNAKIQAYFREQDDNDVSVDIVQEAAELFNELAKDMSEELLPIKRQCLMTLVELTTGCHENQKVILHLSVIDTVNDILRYQPWDKAEWELNGQKGMLASLYDGCAALVQGLVEDNTDSVAETAADLAESLGSFVLVVIAVS